MIFPIQDKSPVNFDMIKIIPDKILQSGQPILQNYKIYLTLVCFIFFFLTF